MTLPLWGVPWHGQVRGGRLYLSNGTSRTYRQPEATSYTNTLGQVVRPTDTYGITHRHAAGMPAVERTPAELAADEAAGREWRNEATLSGGRLQVHNRLINGWIYVDPDGARWLVRCTALQDEPAVSLTTPLAVTVQLIRFGVIGGEAESYSYPLALDFGADTGYSTASLLLDAISPTGNAAVVMAFRRITNNRFFQRDPVVFLELTLAGPGAAATVGSAVVRGFSEIQQSSPAAPHQAWWLIEGEDRTWHAEEPATAAVMFIECVWTGQRSFSTIIAQWYDSDGLRRDVVWRLTGTWAINWPLPEVPPYPDPFPNYIVSSSLSGELQVVFGDEVVSSIPISAQLDMTFDPPSDSYTLGVLNSTHSVTLGGASYSGSATRNRPFSENAPQADFGLLLGVSPLFSAVAGPGMTIGQAIGDDLNPSLGQGSATGTYRIRQGLYWYSRQLPGFEISAENGMGEQPSTRVWRNYPPASPSGPAPGTTQLRTIANPPTYYGSHDPYTGAAAWYEASPVCYV